MRFLHVDGLGPRWFGRWGSLYGGEVDGPALIFMVVMVFDALLPAGEPIDLWLGEEVVKLEELAALLKTLSNGDALFLGVLSMS